MDNKKRPTDGSACPVCCGAVLDIFVLTFGKCPTCVQKEINNLKAEKMQLRIEFAEALDNMRKRLTDSYERINRYVQDEITDAHKHLTEVTMDTATKGM